MARHRNIRTMNYDEGTISRNLNASSFMSIATLFVEYDGYDDVYGHSVEDDFASSPSMRNYHKFIPSK